MAGEDRLRELEKEYEGYKVYDNNGEKIGKVDDLFVDERDNPEYVGVKMGLFGLSGTTLIPLEISRINEQDRAIEVSASKEQVKDAPHYDNDNDIDGAFEQRLREHFGLAGGTGGGRSYDRSTDATGAAAGDNTMTGDDRRMTSGGSRESVGREEYRNDENYVSDSAMGAAAGGGASGGMSDFETGDRESSGEYREGGAEQHQGGQTGEGSGGAGGGQDDRYREGYIEGYREAIRESSGQSSSSGSSASGEGQGGRSGDREGASEYFGAPPAEPGEKGFQDMQDYQSASTGYQPSRTEGEEDEGRTRVRRLRR